MSQKLKPCPFCGSEKVFLDCLGVIHGQNWFVHCKKCRTILCASDGFAPLGFPNAQAASAAWNCRADEPKRIDGKPSGMSAEQFNACYEDDSDER